MDESRIERINALAKKSRTAEGLTDAEKEEQTALRKAYTKAIRKNLEGALDCVYFVDEAGKQEKLKRKGTL